MATSLKLYRPDDRYQAVETVEGHDIDASCELCPLHKGTRRPCMAPEGKPGGLLVVADFPTQREQRPFSGTAGALLRRLVAKYWKGPVAFDYALKCAPGAKKAKPAEWAGWVGSCRGYLARIIEEVQPERVVALGRYAIAALTGRLTTPLSVRSGWAWMSDDTPIFYSVPPNTAVDNRFVYAWLDQDLHKALQDDLPSLPPRDAETFVVDTVDDARDAYFSACDSSLVVYDVETVGEMFFTDIEITCASITFADTLQTWTWNRDAVKDARAAPLVHILEDPSIPVGGQNIKYDLKASYLALPPATGKPVVPCNVVVDTQLQRKLSASEVPSASLATMQELVGMGGGKGEAGAYASAEKKRLQSVAGKARKKAGLLAKQVNPVSIQTALDAGTITRLDAIDIHRGVEPGRYAGAAIPDDVLMRYNAQDTLSTSIVADRILEDRTDADRYVWDTLLTGASEAFAQIELWGMPINEQKVLDFASFLEKKINSVLFDIQFAAKDPDFNPNSTKQVQHLVYSELGCSTQLKTDGGSPSTKEDALLLAAAGYPAAQQVVDDIISYRHYDKLHSTYALGMLNHRGNDGRVHTTYKLDGARTGRLASVDPNLQNIPRPETIEGVMARDQFDTGSAHDFIAAVAKHYGLGMRDMMRIFAEAAGCEVSADDRLVLVNADYSQLELRVAADLSGDPKMKQIFVQGDDYHQRTAELVSMRAWRIQPEAVQKKHRSAAKIINFRTLYGGGDEANAAEIGCTVAEACAIREAIFGEFSLLAKWIKECLRNAQATGCTYTSWAGRKARRRSLHEIAGQSYRNRSSAEKSAWNTPVQGTASDFCLSSVVACVQWLLRSRFPAQLIGTVHDSIMFLTFAKTADALIGNVRPIMEGWPTNNGVPIVADFDFGSSWGSMETIEDCDFCGVSIGPVRPHGAGKNKAGKWHSVCSSAACTTSHRVAAQLQEYQGCPE